MVCKLGAISSKTSMTMDKLEERRKKEFRKEKALKQFANQCCRGRCVAIREYLQLLACQGINLDKQLREYEENMHRATHSSVFFCSRPIQTALSSKFFLILLLGLAMMYASITLVWARRIASGGSHHLRCFRFICSELRDGRTCNGSVGVQELGLLHYESNAGHRAGQLLPLSPEETRWANCTIDLTFPQPVEMNGFFFVTASGSETEAADPVRFLLEGSNCDGRWRVVGASAWRYDWLKTKSEDPSVFRFWDGVYNTTTLRGEMEMFHFQTPTVQTVFIVLLNLCRALMIGIPATFGLCKKEEEGKKAIEIGILCLDAILVPLLVIDPDNRVGMLTNILLSFSFYLCLRFFEDETLFWSSSLVIFGSWCVLGYVISYTVISRVGLLMSIISLCVLFYRDHVLSMSRNLVSYDRARYEEGWRLFVVSMEQGEELKQLSKYLRQVVGASSIHNLQGGMVMRSWLKRKSSDLLQLRFSSSPLASVVQVDRDGAMITSLHRLYSQAIGLQVILADKVKQWAAQSRGYLVVEEEDGRKAFITWEEASALREASAHPYLLSIIPVKAVDRTIEKVSRSYGGDVCRILDICRARIVFDDIEGVSRCLLAMQNDGQVEILRLKGRMTQEEVAFCDDSNLDSFGRRDLILNVCIKNEETLCLGIENHIAEVQLQVVTLAALQTSEAHERYVAVRNMRRE